MKLGKLREILSKNYDVIKDLPLKQGGFDFEIKWITGFDSVFEAPNAYSPITIELWLITSIDYTESSWTVNRVLHYLSKLPDELDIRFEYGDEFRITHVEAFPIVDGVRSDECIQYVEFSMIEVLA